MSALATLPHRQIEKGSVDIVADITVDDDIYCMQHLYGLPKTTVDKDGNTVVSVVTDAQLLPPESSDSPCKARLRIKAFKNERISVEPELADPMETDPYRRNFLQATTNSLKYLTGEKKRIGIDEKERVDRYLTVISECISSYLNTTTSTTTSTYVSPIRSLRYKVCYSDEINQTYSNFEDSVNTVKMEFLDPYIYRNPRYTTVNTTNTTWNADADYVYRQHMNYWTYGERISLKDPIERIKEIIRSRQCPSIIVRKNNIERTTDIREIRARQTLRRLIGEVAFQKYMVRGFVTFRGPSGKTYQLFPGHNRICVWDNGNRIEELCVVLTGDFPPTDALIMRFLLVQESEERIKSLSNASPSYAPSLARLDERPEKKLSLPEIFSGFKKEKLALVA